MKLHYIFCNIMHIILKLNKTKSNCPLRVLHISIYFSRPLFECLVALALSNLPCMIWFRSLLDAGSCLSYRFQYLIFSDVFLSSIITNTYLTYISVKLFINYAVIYELMIDKHTDHGRMVSKSQFFLRKKLTSRTQKYSFKMYEKLSFF